MNKRSPITTHVLDTSRGKAAAKVAVTLERHVGAKWETLAHGTTDGNGRIENLMEPGSQAQVGVYRLSFDIGGYYKAQSATSFYPNASIEFEITKTDEHYHVPLLLSPFGYSTYRGT